MAVRNLTDEERAQLIPFAKQWMYKSIDPTPPDWAAWEAGVKRVYELCDTPWPGVVVKVPHPKRLAEVTAAITGAEARAIYYEQLGGQSWHNWLASLAFARDVMQLPDREKEWEILAAYEAACSAGWWYPHPDFVVVTERPTATHIERIGPDGPGSHQLHRADGPAIEWDGADPWGLYFWHGANVPQWVIMDPSVERIREEPNVEVRRAAIERVGWEEFATQANLSLVDECDDPGNPGQTVKLYDVPRDTWGMDVKILVVTNGSLERTGTRRRYGLAVPDNFVKALDAVAWTAGESPEEYSQTLRRT